MTFDQLRVTLGAGREYRKLLKLKKLFIMGEIRKEIKTFCEKNPNFDWKEQISYNGDITIALLFEGDSKQIPKFFGRSHNGSGREWEDVTFFNGQRIKAEGRRVLYYSDLAISLVD